MASLVACLLNYMFLLRDVGTITEIVLSHGVSFRQGQTIFVSEITTRVTYSVITIYTLKADDLCFVGLIQ